MNSPIRASREFAALQARLREMFEIEARPGRTRTIVVIPSFTVDRDLLASGPEMEYWEHRMLYLLPSLRNAAVRMIYVTSREVSQATLGYYFDLLPGLAREHLMRLTLLTCADPTGDPLAQKLLRRPDLLQQLRNAIDATDDAYIECFASTDAERDLAYALDVPLYGPDPVLARFGLKSQSRAVFRSLEIPTPRGIEGVLGFDSLVHALTELKRERPRLERAVIKLDDSLGGVGNAVFSYAGSPDSQKLLEWVEQELEDRLELALSVIDRDRFLQRISQRECVVEEYVEGDRKRSPSVQCEIKPSGEVLIASTHEQQLTGPVGQHFSGCSLPAIAPTYIQDATRLIATHLRREGVIGWFGVDFIVVEEDAGIRNYATEINLRNVGTAHHLMTLKSLTGGEYDPASGLFVTPGREARCYFGSDSVVVPETLGRRASDLVSHATAQGWAYRASSETGAVLHMIDAAKPYGRLGLTCIGRSPDESSAIFADAVRGLKEIG